MKHTLDRVRTALMVSAPLIAAVAAMAPRITKG
jgi:hypothetical protein